LIENKEIREDVERDVKATEGTVKNKEQII
jgi:hypothetical protein